MKINRIELITNGGYKISVSVEEAKDLYKQLDNMFGVKAPFNPAMPVDNTKIRWPSTSPYVYKVTCK